MPASNLFGAPVRLRIKLYLLESGLANRLLRTIWASRWPHGDEGVLSDLRVWIELSADEAPNVQSALLELGVAPAHLEIVPVKGGEERRWPSG